MITPVELKTLDMKNINFASLEEELDKSIRGHHGSTPWEEAILFGAYSAEILNVLFEKYYNFGWNYIYWIYDINETNMKENRIKIKLSTVEIDKNIIKGYNKYISK